MAVPTRPPVTKRINSGTGHWYKLDGVKVPSVTTIIRDGLPKPALMYWAAKTAAAYAVDNWAELSQEPFSKRLELITKAPNRRSSEAMARGTKIHKLAELLVDGQEVTYPEELAGLVESCVDFLDTWQIDPILSEAAVFSRTYRYAGTLDLLASVGSFDPARTVLIDFKTSASGVYGEAALQLAGYRFAEFYLDRDEQLQPMPQAKECWAVWLRQDGWSVYPMKVDKATFRDFLYVRAVADICGRIKEYKGAELVGVG